MFLTQLPIFVTMFVGIVVLLDFWIKQDGLILLSRELMNWGVIISAFATGLGAANLLRIHAKRLQTQKQDAFYSVVLLVSLVAFTLVGVLLRSTHVWYKYVFDNMLQPLSATVFSFNAFFMLSAAYRAFRIRTAQATVLLVSAILVMLGSVGIGELIYAGMPAVKSWIQNVGTTAGFRGVTIGAALGAIGLSLRVVLGIERSQFGGAGSGGAS